LLWSSIHISRPDTPLVPLAQTGVDPYTIQKLMGHSSFTTTQRYAHHFAESLRRGIEYLEVSRKEREEKISTILAQ
jgi:integrase